MEQDYTQSKRRALELYYREMNDMQRRAVFTIDGPILILAGAGSGKTTTVINRIENMVRFGSACNSARPVDAHALGRLGSEPDGGELAALVAENTIKPWNILAITFTNKAAGELKSRLAQKLGKDGEDVHASTFHSLCVRILRREIGLLGYGQSFTIYDADDSQRVIRDAQKELNIDEKTLAARAVLSAISKSKDRMETPEEMFSRAAGDFRLESIARLYGAYQKRLKANNALDFDDIIINTVRIFQKFPDTLAYYQNRYKYIMVDEYQDTNHAQYLLVSMLAAAHRNICVVGDDDQSIYKFRGATIENILSFENQFDGVTVIRLEQNYRSTGNILRAANKVIENNLGRKGKNLWTSSGDGSKVLLLHAHDEIEESRLIADSILENVKTGAKFSDHAILYRMNAQSSALERSLAKNAIPYRVVGGLRFFDHKEIRDVVAYLSVLNNTSDVLRLLRIINEPKRGIGDATLSAAREVASGLGIGLFEVLQTAVEYAPLAKKSAQLTAFAELIDGLIKTSETEPLDFLLDELLLKTGYMKYLEAQGFEGIGRIENVLELKSIVIKYMQESPKPSLAGFLEEIALYTDLDNYDTSADTVTLMTVHSAKGLEFRYVYIAGMDEGVFPGRMSSNSQEELEEERRLAYVAITRAKERLTIVSAQRRLIFGQTMYNRPSRFVLEIPETLMEKRGEIRPPAAAVKREPRIVGTPSSRTIGVGSHRSGGEAVQPGPTLRVGDRVSHKVFGEGNVLSAKPMAADMLLEIDFGGVGVKKIMANFARLVKVD